MFPRKPVVVAILLLLVLPPGSQAFGGSRKSAAIAYPIRCSYHSSTCLMGRRKKRGPRQQPGNKKCADAEYCEELLESNNETIIDKSRQLNRRDRMRQILERDGPDCVWCRSSLPRPTTDHLIPKLKGGPSWIENEVAACRRCNKRRGHVLPAEWMEICRGKGWEPNAPVVVRCLTALDRNIQQRGGQRKARPHLAKQLKKLAVTAENKQE